MAKFLPLVAALAILISVSNANGQQPTAENDEPQTGSISGSVVNETGQPLANALVNIRAYGSPVLSRSTTTDAQGNFRINALDRRAYMISAGAPSYTSLPRDPDSPEPGYYHVGDSPRISLVKGGVITGAVTGSNGDPVVGVWVRAYMLRDSNDRPPRYSMVYRERSTDDRGVYRIYGLAPGTYVVAASGGTNSGGMNMGFFEGDVPTFSPASTRETATEITVRSGEETTNVDIRYRGEPGHTVSGIVTGPGSEGDSGMSIQLLPIINGASEAASNSYAAPGKRGFAFYGIADGDYYLTAQVYLPPGEWFLSEHKKVTVRGADLNGIELTTRALSSIAGHIILEESKAPDCNGKRRPLFSEIVISSWHNDKNVPKDQPQFVWALGSPVIPNAQGDFVLRNLAPGQYRFNLQPPAKYWYVQSIVSPRSVTTDAKSTDATRLVDAASNWTTLKAGERKTGVTITLAEGAGSVAGKITSEQGQKLPSRAFVYLVPAEPGKTEDVLRFFATQAVNGRFALNYLPPGRYWILAKEVGEAESNILSTLRLPDEVQTRAKLLREAEKAKKEIGVKPCQNVTNYEWSY